MIKPTYILGFLITVSQWSIADSASENLDVSSSSQQSTLATASPVEPISTSSPLTVLLGLLFVLGVIFALAWLVKQYNNSGLMGSRAMKIVASLPLGTRERAVLIEVGEKQILVGVAPGSVNALHVFDEKVIEADSQPEHAFALRR